MRPAPGQVCLDGVEGYSGDVRDLLQTFFFHVKQQQCRPLFGVQHAQGHVKRLMFERSVGFFGCDHRQVFHLGRTVAFGSPFVVTEAVVGNAEEPGGKRGSASERIQMQKGLDEGLLGDVVGQSRIAPAEIAQKPAERFLVKQHLLFKPLPVHRNSFVFAQSGRQ